MNLKEWCEYMRDIRDYFGLSNAYITEKAEASNKTTERIMAINTDQDIMRATARRYEQAVIGPVGEFTCYMDNDGSCDQERIAELEKKLEHLIKENKRYAMMLDKYFAD